MKRIRVLIANQPRLMRELICGTIADQTDIELVGEVGREQDLADAVAGTRPDVLIIAMDDRNRYHAQCGFLLGRYPEMRIVALESEKNRALLYWAVLDVRSMPLESSEEGILHAVRQGPEILRRAGNSGHRTPELRGDLDESDVEIV